MIEKITFVVSGPASKKNSLGPERLSVVINFASDFDAFDGFDAFCDKVAAALEHQGLKPGTGSGETFVQGSTSVDVDDEGAPGVENRHVSFSLQTDFGVHETRDLVVKAMEDAGLKPAN